MPSAGGQVSVLTSDSVDHEYPEWSLGGGIIYQRQDSTDYLQLYLVATTGGSEQALTNSPVDHELPKPLSATQTIFQREGDDGNMQIYELVRTATCTLEQALTAEPYDHENPAVAQSTGDITYQIDLFNSCSQACYSQIGILKSGTSTEQILTGGEHDFETPAISPGGDAIHCIERGSPGDAVCYVYPGGDGWYQITDEQAERNHPNSTMNATCGLVAAFEREDGVYRTADGSEGGGQSGSIAAIALSGMYPNPMTDNLRIYWSLSQEADIRVSLYNSAGRVVARLVEGKTRPGVYVTNWNGTDARGRRLPAGIYFCQLETGKTRLNRKIVLTQ